MWIALDRPSIAYVDSAILLERYDRAVAARASLTAQLEAWEQNVQTLQREASALGNRLTSADLSRTQREAVSDSLNQKQREIARYVEATSRKAAEKEEEVLQPVYAELNARMKAYSEERSIDLLLGTMAGGNILYGADGVDVTEDLLAYLNGDG